MILLPIKIHDSEKSSLPHCCCSNCLEILVTAFKLRETSLLSDRFLRSNNDSTTIDIKTEKEVEDFTYEEEILSDPDYTQTFVSSLDYKQPQPVTPESSTHDVYDLVEIYSEDLQVDFFKRKGRTKNASKVWEYFGRLVNGNEEMVGSQDFHYCSLCLQNKKIVKYRTTSATTSLSNHLESVHGVMRDGEVIEPARNDDFKQPKKRRFEGGAATICSECGKVIFDFFNGFMEFKLFFFVELFLLDNP